MITLRPLAAGLLLASSLCAQDSLKAALTARLDAEYPSLEKIYLHLHQNPELSLMEVNTSALVAKELRALGIEVTERVGGYGVVGVLANGPGPVVMLRADMDGLPVKENSGVPYASTAIVKDITGKDSPAMHACAHDTHITSLIGTARLLVSAKAQWGGTVVFVAQPAEEIGAGARAMLMDGLYTRFPRPDFVVASHTWSNLPAGTVGFVEGPAYANVDTLDITVRGIGGHGSQPQSTKDPVVLAAQIVIALQTIVSRELTPGTPAVVTVGSIHGGSKHNIISDEVKLELTLRSYDLKTAAHLIESIKRIAEHTARAAGIPEDLLPIVKHALETIPVTTNDPTLTRRLASGLRGWLGENQVVPVKPTTGGEDFSQFGLTNPRIPISILFVGGADPAKYEESIRTGTPLPTNHSATFAPPPGPTLKTATNALTASALELLAKR